MKRHHAPQLKTMPLYNAVQACWCNGGGGGGIGAFTQLSEYIRGS